MLNKDLKVELEDQMINHILKYRSLIRFHPFSFSEGEGARRADEVGEGEGGRGL